MALTTEQLRYILTLDPKKFTGALRSVKEQVEKTRKTTETPLKFRQEGAGQILNNIKSIAAAWLSFRAVVGSVDIFREFETGIANIATLGVENIGELEESILRIGSTTPIALNDLTSGLYQVVSAGVDASNQLQVLENSARAAKAGLAETSDALGLAAAVVKAYGLEWSETESILDRAFQTVKLGQTTFGELSVNIGKVAPLAATLKVSTEELFGGHSPP
jgi:TP901 family phage tail tape measure protein